MASVKYFLLPLRQGLRSVFGDSAPAMSRAAAPGPGAPGGGHRLREGAPVIGAADSSVGRGEEENRKQVHCLPVPSGFRALQ